MEENKSDNKLPIEYEGKLIADADFLHEMGEKIFGQPVKFKPYQFEIPESFREEYKPIDGIVIIKGGIDNVY